MDRNLKPAQPETPPAETPGVPDTSVAAPRAVVISEAPFTDGFTLVAAVCAVAAWILATYAYIQKSKSKPSSSVLDMAYVYYCFYAAHVFLLLALICACSMEQKYALKAWCAVPFCIAWIGVLGILITLVVAAEHHTDNLAQTTSSPQTLTNAIGKVVEDALMDPLVILCCAAYLIFGLVFVLSRTCWFSRNGGIRFLKFVLSILVTGVGIYCVFTFYVQHLMNQNVEYGFSNGGITNSGTNSETGPGPAPGLGPDPGLGPAPGNTEDSVPVPIYE